MCIQRRTISMSHLRAAGSYIASRVLPACRRLICTIFNSIPSYHHLSQSAAQKQRTAPFASSTMSSDNIETELQKMDTAGSVLMTKELFEKLYLSPETKVAGQLRKTFANPTPLYVSCGRDVAARCTNHTHAIEACQASYSP